MLKMLIKVVRALLPVMSSIVAISQPSASRDMLRGAHRELHALGITDEDMRGWLVTMARRWELTVAVVKRKLRVSKGKLFADRILNLRNIYRHLALQATLPQTQLPEGKVRQSKS